MIDWLIFVGSVLLLALAVRARNRALFPPDPPRWRATGLGMSVRNGRITYRKIKR